MDTQYLNDPEQFMSEITDPVAKDMLEAMGRSVFNENSDPAKGLALYRVQHDGWRVTDASDFSPHRTWRDQKFGKGKRETQIVRALGSLMDAGIISDWDSRTPMDQRHHILVTLSDRWGDLESEQAKRDKERADKDAVYRMRSIRTAREKVRRSRAEVHRARQKLLLEDIPAFVEYIKSVDPDQSTPLWGWDTPEHTLRSTFSQMERAMSDRKSHEEWMQREIQQEA